MKSNQEIADGLVELLDENIKELIESTNNAAANYDMMTDEKQLAYIFETLNKQAVTLAMTAALVRGLYDALSNLGQELGDLDL